MGDDMDTTPVVPGLAAPPLWNAPSTDATRIDAPSTDALHANTAPVVRTGAAVARFVRVGKLPPPPVSSSSCSSASTSPMLLTSETSVGPASVAVSVSASACTPAATSSSASTSVGVCTGGQRGQSVQGGSAVNMAVVLPPPLQSVCIAPLFEELAIGEDFDGMFRMVPYMPVDLRTAMLLAAVACARRILERVCRWYPKCITEEAWHNGSPLECTPNQGYVFMVTVRFLQPIRKHHSSTASNVITCKRLCDYVQLFHEAIFATGIYVKQGPVLAALLYLGMAPLAGWAVKAASSQAAYDKMPHFDEIAFIRHYFAVSRQRVGVLPDDEIVYRDRDELEQNPLNLASELVQWFCPLGVEHRKQCAIHLKKESLMLPAPYLEHCVGYV